MYRLILLPEAQEELKNWGKSGQKKVQQKISDLFKGLKEHPRTGTGKVEKLKGNLSGYWSRRTTKEARMIYLIEDDKVIVTVISLMGHYDDK